MEHDEFWTIVERARAAVDDTATFEGAQAVAERVVARLTELGPAGAVEFQLVYDALERASYRNDLWAAAYLMCGGCSDDGFDYFRGWLVAQGRTVWERALADPDSLADVRVDPDEDAVWCEEMLAAAGDAYAAVTGDEEAFWAALKAAAPDPPKRGNNAPAGEDFDFDDDAQMRARLPRLAAIYLPE